jgi:acetolactate synthase-1/2/3 large subunit
MLRAAKAPVVFCGSGAYWDHAEDELDAFISAFRAPVFLNGMGRGLVPASNPYLFQRSRKRALKNADLLLVLGAEFDFRLGYGRGSRFHPEVSVIQVSSQAERIGGRKVDLGVVSSIRLFLKALMTLESGFGRITDSGWTQQIREEELVQRDAVRAELQSGAIPIHPMRLIGELQRFLDPDAVVVGDGGDILARAGGELTTSRPGHWLDPGPFGCLGVGVPFAMAARLARPRNQIVALFGDGAFGFNAFEYDSAVRQRLPFVGVIGNDGAWGEMKVFQKHLFGAENLVAHDLSQRTKYELVVDALGGAGERVERPQDIRPALERAAKSGVPSVVNVILDPAIERSMGTVGEVF